jgi:voltage-dependent potassium channel beta subunit
MHYRRLGNSGLKVSALALGGWITFEDLRQSGVREVTRAALDQGVNFFDLADEYGKGAAEELVGNLMREFRREDLVLSTKCYWPITDDPNDRGLSRKHILQSVDASLNRLNTPYVDLFFCHRYDDETPVEETIRAIDHLIRQGKVLYWGTSMWTSEQIDEAVRVARELGCYPPIAEQPRYNLVDRGIEADIVPTARKHGIGLTVWSTLAQGVLTGKYNDGIPSGSRADTYEWAKTKLQEADIAAARRLAPIADGLGVPLANLALAWTLRLPEVSCAIMGATTREQVADNAAAADLVLSPDTLAAIEKALAGA